MANTKSIDLELSSSQYLSHADNASLSITGDISIMGWFNLEQLPSTNGSPMKLVIKDGTTSQRGFTWQIHNSWPASDTMIFDYLPTDGSSITQETKGGIVVSGDVGNWVHLAVTADVSAQDIKFYKNGVLQTGTVTQASDASAIGDNTTDFQIGARDVGGTPGHYFDGKIDEVSYWDKVLTSTEVSDNYNSGDGEILTGSETKLVGYWRFEDDLTDETSNANTLTNNNAATYSTDVPFAGADFPILAEACTTTSAVPAPTVMANLVIEVDACTTTSTVPAPTVVVPGANTITLTEPTDRSIAQRNSSDQGSLLIEGTYTGTPTNIEARIVLDGTSTEVKTWTTIDSSPSANAFSGTITGVDQGGWYNVQVRFSNDTGTTDDGTSKWGVGMIVAVYGQSNAEFWFWTDWGTSLTKDDLVSWYNPQGWNATGSGSTWGDNTIANGAMAFGNAIVDSLSIPVALVDAGVASAAIADLNTGTNFNNLITLTDAVGGSVEYVLWAQGETDGMNATAQATYHTALGTLLTNLRANITAVSGTLPMITSIPGRYTDGTEDAGWNNVRAATIQKIAGDSDVYKGGETITYDLNGNIHYGSGTEGYIKHGKLIAQAVLDDLGEVTYSTGPSIDTFTLVTSTIVYVNITHSGGTDFTPTTGITGFEVFDDGSPVTISSAVRENADTIRLTLASAITGTATARYLWGVKPTVTGAVKDNTSLLYPLQGNTSITQDDNIVLLVDECTATSAVPAPTVTTSSTLAVDPCTTTSGILDPTVITELDETVLAGVVINTSGVPAPVIKSDVIWENVSKSTSIWTNESKS